MVRKGGGGGGEGRGWGPLSYPPPPPFLFGAKQRPGQDRVKKETCNSLLDKKLLFPRITGARLSFSTEI